METFEVCIKGADLVGPQVFQKSTHETPEPIFVVPGIDIWGAWQAINLDKYGRTREWVSGAAY